MPDILSHPILGTLYRRNELEWVGRVWFTPKHEVEIVFDQWTPDADDVPEQLALASAAFVALRNREWEYRLKAAGQLVEMAKDEWIETEPLALARQLCLVRILLYGDASSSVLYHGPEPWEGRIIEVGVSPQGEFHGVDVYAG